MGIKTICPKCFSTKIKVKHGAQLYREGDFLKIPDDFAEVHYCDECGYHGINVIDGNEVLIKFLKENPFRGKRKEIEQPKEMHEIRHDVVFGPKIKQEDERVRQVGGIKFKIPKSNSGSRIIEG
ncbi:MAG: hypothetical protein AB1467_05075 [Candidatus Diapherotrites archaeon]